MHFLCNVWGLSVEEWLLGQSRDEQDFNAVYRPWLGRSDMGAQERRGAGAFVVIASAGEPEADSDDESKKLQGVGAS